MRVCILLSAVLVLFQSGCGPSKKVIEAQDRDIQQAYEEAARNPPDLPPHLQKRRQWRIEKEFGVKPSADQPDTEAGKQP